MRRAGHQWFGTLTLVAACLIVPKFVIGQEASDDDRDDSEANHLASDADDSSVSSESDWKEELESRAVRRQLGAATATTAAWGLGLGGYAAAGVALWDPPNDSGTAALLFTPAPYLVIFAPGICAGTSVGLGIAFHGVVRKTASSDMSFSSGPRGLSVVWRRKANQLMAWGIVLESMILAVTVPIGIVAAATGRSSLAFTIGSYLSITPSILLNSAMGYNAWSRAASDLAAGRGKSVRSRAVGPQIGLSPMGFTIAW